MAGIQEYNILADLLDTIQKSVLFKFFDIMISILRPEDIREVTMFMVDKDSQIKDVASLIKSLCYEGSIKEYIDGDHDEDYCRMTNMYLKAKKRARFRNPFCSICDRPLDFKSLITNRCDHAVSVFCAAGISICPMSYNCPRCLPETSIGKLRLMLDVQLEQILFAASSPFLVENKTRKKRTAQKDKKIPCCASKAIINHKDFPHILEVIESNYRK